MGVFTKILSIIGFIRLSFFAIIIFFTLISFVSFDTIGISSLIEGRSYDLTHARSTVDLHKDGLVVVDEEIGYDFRGCYREVYRTPKITRQDYPNVNEPVIIKTGGKCDPACQFLDRGYELAGTFGQICDRKAAFYPSFTVKKGLVVGDDAVEFHYKMWGDEWNKKVGSLDGVIVLPQGIDHRQVKIYFNPLETVEEYKIEQNSITFSVKDLDHYLEARIILPKDAFSYDDDSSRANFAFHPGLKRDDMIKIQDDYARRYAEIKAATIAISILLLLTAVIVPYVLFRKYGRELDVQYNAVFAREAVKGIKPYVVNSLLSRRTGDTDKNAIPATILDLIRRGHVSIREETKKAMFSDKKDLVFTFIDYPNDATTPAEREIFHYLRNKADKKNELRWSEFLKTLGKESDAKSYKSMEDSFEREVDKSYDIKRYFDSKGNTVFKTFCVAIGIITFIAYWSMSSLEGGNYPFLDHYPRIIMILIVGSAIAGLFLPRNVFGKFSPEGYFIYLKSEKYKKFLTDMTLLKQYPPGSVKIWEEHLVYATLFGVAEEVVKAMRISVDEKTLRQSTLYPVYLGGNLSSLTRAHSVAAGTMRAAAMARAGSGGGGRGVGGGFGGGGGGAR